MEFTSTDRTIYFDFDKSTLTADGRSKLDAIAQTAQTQGKVVSGKIIGHADPIGNTSYNQKLSERRAKAVKDYLAKKGFVDTTVVQTTAVGESQPAVTNCSDKRSATSIACQQPNRRVEVSFDLSGQQKK